MRALFLFQISFFLSFLMLQCTGSRSENAASSGEGEPAVISGSLENSKGQQVILEEMAAREYIPLDTAVCDEEGAFRFSLYPEEVAFYVLRYGQVGYVTLLIEPGESLQFSGDYDDPGSWQVSGSKGSELLTELAMKHQEILEELRTIARENRELSSTESFSEMKPLLDQKFDSVTNAFREYSLGFIHENAGSLAILVALYNLYGDGLPVFHPAEDLQVYQFVDSVLTRRYAGFEAVDLLHAQVLQAEQMSLSRDIPEKLKPGELAPDFVSSRPDGSQLALSGLEGNYVLLSFWAGWSRLSREENPFLRRAAERYGKSNFRILQVSFDDNREVWMEAIEEDRLEWDQVSDLVRWETPVADLYRVERIPSNYLIDPSGRIIASDLFGEMLLEKLETIFSAQ